MTKNVIWLNITITCLIIVCKECELKFENLNLLILYPPSNMGPRNENTKLYFT